MDVKKLIPDWSERMINQAERLRHFKWYHVPSFALNQVLAAKTAHCQTISYGTHERHALDLYTPAHQRSDGALIIFVHGGSWLHGDKADYQFLGQYFASFGFYVATINYRLAPQYGYYDFISDTIQAINWLHTPEHAKALGFCAAKSILLGHSAGAFNVMAALYHSQDDFSHHINHPEFIKAAIGIAGPYSFDHRGDPLAQYSLPQQLPPSAIMPNYFVQSNAIAHLLLVAERDTMVGIKNAERLRDALQRVNNQVTLKTIMRTNHISIMGTLSRGLAKLFTTEQVVLNFIDEAINRADQAP